MAEKFSRSVVKMSTMYVEQNARPVTSNRTKLTKTRTDINIYGQHIITDQHIWSVFSTRYQTFSEKPRRIFRDNLFVVLSMRISQKCW